MGLVTCVHACVRACIQLSIPIYIHLHMDVYRLVNMFLLLQLQADDQTTMFHKKGLSLQQIYLRSELLTKYILKLCRPLKLMSQKILQGERE